MYFPNTKHKKENGGLDKAFLRGKRKKCNQSKLYCLYVCECEYSAIDVKDHARRSMRRAGRHRSKDKEQQRGGDQKQEKRSGGGGTPWRHPTG
jgi:hypothetical protein